MQEMATVSQRKKWPEHCGSSSPMTDTLSRSTAARVQESACDGASRRERNILNLLVPAGSNSGWWRAAVI
jgi:hypothetical protein